MNTFVSGKILKKIDMYTYKYLLSFVHKVFLKMGCSDEDAAISSEILMAAELRGINSHGVIRLPDYYRLWQQGRINTTPHIKQTHETLSTATIDGDGGLGMVVASKAMKLAIKKAKKCGTGWVAVRNSNHFSIAGYYSMMALEHDMIGITMTNANPLVAPTFSIDRLLGTNPIAVAIPAGKYPPFVADFATTPIARGKLQIMHTKGLKAPDGYVQDKNGEASNDPNILTEGGAILPLGGDREHGSHKGYCLSAIVDIFSAVFSGANFGPFAPPSVPYLPVLEKSSGKGIGHFLGAMRIDAFQDARHFKSQMDYWIETFQAASVKEGHEKVLIPGEPETELETINRKKGIYVLDAVKAKLVEIANDLEIEFVNDK